MKKKPDLKTPSNNNKYKEKKNSTREHSCILRVLIRRWNSKASYSVGCTENSAKNKTVSKKV